MNNIKSDKHYFNNNNADLKEHIKANDRVVYVKNQLDLGLDPNCNCGMYNGLNYTPLTYMLGQAASNYVKYNSSNMDLVNVLEIIEIFKSYGSKISDPEQEINNFCEEFYCSVELIVTYEQQAEDHTQTVKARMDYLFSVLFDDMNKKAITFLSILEDKNSTIHSIPKEVLTKITLNLFAHEGDSYWKEETDDAIKKYNLSKASEKETAGDAKVDETAGDVQVDGSENSDDNWIEEADNTFEQPAVDQPVETKKPKHKNKICVIQ